MKLKRFMILLFSGILFIIVLCSYRLGRQTQVLSDREPAAGLNAENQTAENQNAESEGIKTDEKIVNKDEIKSEITYEIGNETENKQETETESETEETDNESSRDAFYYTALTDDIRYRITGKSYPDTEEALQISYDDLAYVHVLYYDFDAHIQEGELICSRLIAQDLTEIFSELYDNQYPIEKICLIDAYDADDEASMADNNTSCFNYRTIPGKTKLSNHSYGCAIDINPLYNPYVRTKNGETLISPDNAAAYADRSADFPHKIDQNDLCYKVFIRHGFNWGGEWNSSKDYQHFEKTQ